MAEIQSNNLNKLLSGELQTRQGWKLDKTGELATVNKDLRQVEGADHYITRKGKRDIQHGDKLRAILRDMAYELRKEGYKLDEDQVTVLQTVLINKIARYTGYEATDHRECHFL